MPLSSVPESRRDTPKVTARLRQSRQTSKKADNAPARRLLEVGIKNMLSSRSNVGKRPLQGVKQLVRMAISRSRGESMIRHPTTPAALHPSPMHMHSACLPQAWQRWKGRSRL